MENPLAALSEQLANLVESAAASTVAVLSDGAFAASGVLWQSGAIVTVDHALKKPGKLSVRLADGRMAEATLKGRAKGADLAVLSADVQGPLPVLGDPAQVRAGQLMLVSGRSLDTGVNATMGVVSAVSGAWKTWRGGQIDRFIRLDVALFPGVDGGAVLDAQGRILGIATNALSRIAGVVIPAATIDAAIVRVNEGKRSGGGFLGVGLHEVDYQGRKLPIVLSVKPESGAAKAGVLVGDLIDGIDGKAVNGVMDVWTALLEAGGSLDLNLIRGGQPPFTARVELSDRPGEEPEC
jgi:S1-C subfamily serine protease